MRKHLSIALSVASVLAALAQAGCGGSSAPPPTPPAIAAPAELGYATNPAVYHRGTAIAANAPHSTGGAVASYSVSPALPAGLGLDANTGVLTGTPTAIAAQASYTVTATNAGGSATTALSLTVTDAAPAGLLYAVPKAVYTKGVAIAANGPTSTGGAVTGYSVSPALPAGLTLDATTGVITGTPAAVVARFTYTVLAFNAGGGATTGLELTVADVQPAALSYGANPVTYYLNNAIAPNSPASPGAVLTTYRVAPPLPAGLLLDAATGFVSGTPGAITPTATYLVTATNTGGSTTASLVITVQDQAPAALAYATNPSSYTINTAIQPNLPSNAGGLITGYAVSPALPAGLVLDAATGVISGTPTALSAQATYVITGSNATASTTCSFVTSVVAAAIPPPATPVVTTVAYATAGKAGYAASTQDQGSADGMGYLWTLTNGTITAGQGTRSITFTAGAVGPLTAQVKATNLGGSATGSAATSVEPVPAARIFAQERVLRGTTGVQASVAPQANMTWQWSLSGSSAGTLSAGGSNVATYSAGAQAGSYQLSVTVQNRAGDQATAARTLAVVANAFVDDPRAAPQRQQHSMTTLLDGRVLVAGGIDARWVTASALLYDPYTDSWSPVAPLAVARASHTATLLLDGRVLVTGGGGSDSNLNPLSSAELFDPATRTWSSATDMSTVRQDHAATRLADGRVLISGGVPLLTDANYAFLDSAEIYDPAFDSWEVVGTMTLKRAGHTSTLLADGRVVLTGGYSQQGSIGWQRSIDLFNPKTNSWTAGTPMSGSRSGHTADPLANGKVLVTGGNGSAPTNSAVLFDPAANGGLGAWSATANTLATGRYQHKSLVLSSGKVLVVSGKDGTTTSKEVSTAELFDPATSSWSSGGTLSSAAWYHGVALLPGGKAYSFGGVNGSSSYVHSNGQLYDEAQNGWSNAGGLANPRYSHTTTALPGGVLLVAGGAGPKGSIPFTELFDPASGGWSQSGSMIGARSLHTASLLGNGKVLVAGGWGATGDVSSAELYTPATKSWEAAPAMAVNRSEHTATVLADGRVLVTGGWLTSSTVGASAALYDPAANAWTATGDLSAARYGHRATLLASGKVLVTGGRNASGYLSSVDLFDPVANTWSAAAPMNSPRLYHTATLLSGGKVLVTGGKINASIHTASAELYDPVANTWTVMAPMGGVRGSHAATLLAGEQILVTGGDGGPYGPALQTAERYDSASNTWTPVASLQGPRSNHTATAVGADGAVLIVGGDPSGTVEVWKP